jgi:hypothetical protein
MFARHVTVHGSPDHIDDGVRVQLETVVPVLRRCEGFRAQIFLVDRATGDVIGISLWETEADMLASEAQVRPVRQRVAQHMAASAAPDVRAYEMPVFELA